MPGDERVHDLGRASISMRRVQEGAFKEDRLTA
jgi:hypothetical protein